MCLFLFSFSQKYTVGVGIRIIGLLNANIKENVGCINILSDCELSDHCGVGLYYTPGGATWFQLYPDVCVEKGRTWVPFRPQVSEMSDMISLKMGVNFATSLNMAGRLPKHCIS